MHVFIEQQEEARQDNGEPCTPTPPSIRGNIQYGNPNSIPVD